MAVREVDRPLYAIFQRFIHQCLIEDGSLLWSRENLWTLENLSILNEAIIQNADTSKDRFEEKLWRQMEKYSPRLWGILADIAYLYCIVPFAGAFGVENKKALIQFMLDQSSLPPPDSFKGELEDALQKGICHPGLNFLMKYRAFWFVLRFSKAVKEKSAEERKALFAEYRKVQTLLDQCLEEFPKADRAYNMRSAMLYLGFPEQFERIVSQGDKKLLMEWFKKEFTQNLPEDPDEAIRIIRRTLEEQKGFPPSFDFYDPDIKKIWKDGITNNGPTHLPEPLPQLLKILEFTRNLILYGPPGTGKTYLANRLALELVKKSLGNNAPEQDLEKYIQRVSFHQSYSYEDFIEGIRPTPEGKIQVVPGKFRQICQTAEQNPSQNYVLNIDEINRGNISKIFGELITLIEDDKRGKYPTRLTYSHAMFTVPPNLYIIGTMNTADRSIALLDIALRRRFAFFELMPDSSLLKNKVIKNEDGESVNLQALLDYLNRKITEHLGRDYQIGHSYFLNVNSPQSLFFVWNHAVYPLLREYYYSRPDQLQELLTTPNFSWTDSHWEDLSEENDLITFLGELSRLA